ncbi:unnamed protein product [Acanthocheilonema viteae]|uniref:Uncharacterized protein n=1 Tax=Acanthocheilonema viteae TaxID=6277 RepID=A0A498SCN2_ACAVI|nr:unnamed protein product [Acanthocheilonema viteae]
MVWRNDSNRVRRRLPNIPSEAKSSPTLERLNLGGMLPPILSVDHVERPTLLEMDDDRTKQLSFSERSLFSWSPTIRLTFPMYSTQRRELFTEEGIFKTFVCHQKPFTVKGELFKKGVKINLPLAKVNFDKGNVYL